MNRLKIRGLKSDEFQKAMELLDKELKDRVRIDEFLLDKFSKFPEFFIGAFLDNRIVGVICGFPRENYLLIDEIAVDSGFQRRGAGKRLIEEFEKNANGRYKEIRVGTLDNAIGFYESLVDYKPFLLVQYKNYRKDRKNEKEDFAELEILKEWEDEAGHEILEIRVGKADLDLLDRLREKYPKAIFQYIFTKSIESNV